MKATALLKKQHRRVERILERLEHDESDASTLLTELANDLAAHMAIEQTIFYPAVRDIDSEMVSEGYQEHAIAELALKRLLSTAPDDETFVAKVTALRDLIEHHVEEEEDSSSFRQSKTSWTASSSTRWAKKCSLPSRRRPTKATRLCCRKAWQPAPTKPTSQPSHREKGRSNRPLRNESSPSAS